MKDEEANIQDSGKGEPLVKDNDPTDESQSKTKLFMLYGGTVGAVLLVVVIVFIISLKVGGSSSNKDEGGSLCAVYETKNENENVTLISSKYKDYVSSIKVNGKKENFKEIYVFKKPDNYTVELFFNKKLDTMEKMFKNCSHLK